jgi:hypothetical protein
MKKLLYSLLLIVFTYSLSFAQAGNFFDGNGEHIEGWEGSKGAWCGKGNAGGGFDGSSNICKSKFGSFEDNGSTWTFGQAGGGGWAIDGTNDEADCDGVQTSTVDLEQDVGQSVGHNWYIAFTIKNYSAGTVTPIFGGTTGTARSADGAYIERLQAVDTTNLKLRASSDFVGSVDNIAAFGELSTAYIKDVSDESITPREDSQYLHIEATWPGEGGDRGLFFMRSYFYAEGQDLTGGNKLTIDDGTEYWIAFSVYIEAGYQYGPYGSGIFTMSAPAHRVFNIASLYNEDGDAKSFLRIGASEYQIFTSKVFDWIDLAGTWVDIVVRYRPYTTDNAYARVWVYVNGEVAWGTPADGLQNVPTASSLSAGGIRLYNWWSDYCDSGVTVDCDVGTCWGSDPAALACDTAGWTRDVRFDA